MSIACYGENAMKNGAVLTLSPREREVLRLVARDRNSGEIAAILGRSIGTIDNQIKSARTKLGGVDRFTAARLLAEHEGISQSLASLRWDISDRRPEDDDNQAGVTAGPTLLMEVHEDQQALTFELSPTPVEEPDRNDLSSVERFSAIGVVMVLVAVGAFVGLACSFVIQLILKTH